VGEKMSRGNSLAMLVIYEPTFLGEVGFFNLKEEL
jgi:hypothetical protein